MSKPTLFVSFSGGRTSGYMCHWLLENKADKYDLKFVFANTGQEHEKTLEFVDKCDKHFGLNLVWVEAVVNPEHGKGIRHKIVDYETAARDGEPFEAFIAKHGIPNAAYNQCSERIKSYPMESYRRSLGFKSNHQTAVGIRSDEIDRASPTAKKNGLIYPLITMTQVTKADVFHWWAEQPFDLEIPEHHGNCLWCWKKSDRKLWTLAKYHPEWFAFPDRMEREHKQTGPADEDRVFFRNHRTVQDILEEIKTPFVEFEENRPPLQLGMFDPIDIESDCGSGCEIG